jgi:transcriptional regulator with XRE-family HTH domain
MAAFSQISETGNSVFRANSLVSETKSIIPKSCTMVPYMSSTVAHQRSVALRYVPEMGKTQEKMKVVLSNNIRVLMKEFPVSKAALSRKSGVSVRMIGYVLAKEKTATVDIVEQLAGAFGLAGWQLLIPNLTVELAKNGKLGKLIDNYARSSSDGRVYIERVAEKEAGYKG